MPEHLIRLRGGWEWLGPGDDAPRRVALPITWPERSTGRVRLTRPFHAPPLDPSRESLSLRLESVAGLVAASLNGRVLARPEPGTAALTFPIDRPLPPRNVLVLEADPPETGRGEPWGMIALVIRRP